MNEQIQRYDVLFNPLDLSVKREESDDGFYVLYTDHQQSIAAKDRRIAELEQALEGIIDPEPCRFDHHGYCQEHGCFGEPGWCAQADAKAALSGDTPHTGDGA